MLERLIELLRNIPPMETQLGGRACGKTYKTMKHIAKHLLAHGVIVPPCKVGDTVYMITPNGDIRNLTILSIDIEVEAEEVKITCLAVYEFEGKPCYMQIPLSKFGKTVFLTKEEAEKALAERSER